jgi:cob(I)alamin adenosyltransferase
LALIFKNTDMNKGLLQVYTGDGKGKTTAAFGLAFRAYGRGFKVGVVQFMKSWVTGEVSLAQTLENFHIKRIDTSPKFTWEMNEAELEELKIEIRNGFEYVRNLVKENAYDVLILDEINHIINHKFVSKEEIMELLNLKPESMEIVMTGRNAPDWLMEKADLVTEMKCIKHPFDKGIPARVGIEK